MGTAAVRIRLAIAEAHHEATEPLGGRRPVRLPRPTVQVARLAAVSLADMHVIAATVRATPMMLRFGAGRPV